MSDGLVFLAGFVTGGFTVFIVLSATVWLPLYNDLRDKWREERRRRIAAEDSSMFGADGPSGLTVRIGGTVEQWDDLSDFMPPTASSGTVLDLTDLDDVPEGE